MLTIILLIALIFSFVAFGTNIPTANNQNVLINYSLNSIAFIGNHFFLFLLGFTVICFLVFRSLKIELLHPQKNHILIIFTQALFIIITGIFTSFILLFLLAVFELNILAYFININPKILGIQTDIKSISNSLKTNKQIPNIIATENNHFKELVAISAATTGTNNFYGKYILASVPSFVVIPSKNLGSTILIDKTLIISSIKKQDLEIISPIIGYLFVKNYFPQYSIKNYPKISILNDKEHVEFRRNDFAKKVAELKTKVESSNSQVASTSALLQKNNEDLAYYQNLLNRTYLEKNKLSSSCIAEGYYKENIFIKTNSKDYCNSLTEKQDETINSLISNENRYSKEIKKNTELLRSHQLINNFFKAQITLTDALRNNIPDELGLFTPEDSIKIMVDTNSPHAIADYFETVVHEYYHYTSHTKDKSFNTVFFEEGLTEYFARNTIKDSLNTSTNMGFPIFVKIIKQITKMIPEAEIAEIYFNKDNEGLERSINRVYGDNFYKDNILLFETLPYTSNPKDLLGYANKIMAKIKGPILKDSDLYSTTSNY